MDGSLNTKKSIQVLTTMDLPTKTIVDLDFALKNSVLYGYLKPDDEDIFACKNELIIISKSNNKISIGKDGWPQKSNNSLSAAESFAILAQSQNIKYHIQNVCSKMKSHNIWVWNKGTIENHLNLGGKTEFIWTTFINKLETNDLQSILPNDYQEIERCINWLLK
jgi:hypothetical protein